MKNVDILDVLLDKDNILPIYLYDDCGKMYEFEQVAVIDMNDKLYAILKPQFEVDGKKFADNESIVFYVDCDEEGNNGLIMETDESKTIEVFNKYYDLLTEYFEKYKGGK